MQPVLRVQGRQVSDAADGCFEGCSGLRSSRTAVVSGLAPVLGQSDGQLLWLSPQAKNS